MINNSEQDPTQESMFTPEGKPDPEIFRRVLTNNIENDTDSQAEKFRANLEKLKKIQEDAKDRHDQHSS